MKRHSYTLTPVFLLMAISVQRPRGRVEGLSSVFRAALHLLPLGEEAGGLPSRHIFISISEPLVHYRVILYNVLIKVH